MTINAILLLAGKSERFNQYSLKQFYKIGEKDLFLYTLEEFLKNKDINSIVLVVPKGFTQYVQTKTTPYVQTKPIYIVEGSTTRQLSVFNALLSIKQYCPSDYVLIHDAVRPGITSTIINSNIENVIRYGATSTVLAINDSILSINEEHTDLEYLNRETTFLVQTPQAFRFDLIFNAHEKAYNNASFDAKDDLSLIDKSISVKLVEGSICNLKVTTSDDLELITNYLIQR